jgi:DNA-binding transcriptional regulator PaaX
MQNSLEYSTKERAHRDRIQRNIVLLLARLTARQGRFLFVPDKVLIKELGLTEKVKSPSSRVQQALQRLERKGMVSCTKSNSSWGAQLTPKGRNISLTLDASQQLLRKPKKWDGRWRVIIFDIWERRRPVRDKLRNALKNAGFYKLQDSVWTYPYDCEDLLVFLRAELRLGSGVLYIIADGIEGDRRLRKYFDLP